MQAALFQFEKAAVDPSLIFVREPSGDYRVATPREVIKAANVALRQTVKRGESFKAPEELKAYFSIRLGAREQEVFAVLFLDARHRLIEYEELFFGTIASSAVHPREVVKRALHHNAAAAVITHNHPSGDPTPSEADKKITKVLGQALALVDVRLLDHIVVGGEHAVSMSESGML